MQNTPDTKRVKSKVFLSINNTKLQYVPSTQRKIKQSTPTEGRTETKDDPATCGVRRRYTHTHTAACWDVATSGRTAG